MQYVYFAPGSVTATRTVELSEPEAERVIGNRVLLGFHVVQQCFQTPSGEYAAMIYFQSEVTGSIWAVYH